MNKEQKFITDFINEVNKKEIEYWNKYEHKPNHIMISKALLMRWKLNFIYIMEVLIKDIQMIYGMQVHLTDKVKK